MIIKARDVYCMTDLRQILILCVETLKKLNDHMPSADELYRALGSEYSDVIAEMFSTQ